MDLKFLDQLFCPSLFHMVRYDRRCRKHFIVTEQFPWYNKATENKLVIRSNSCQQGIHLFLIVFDLVNLQDEQKQISSLETSRRRNINYQSSREVIFRFLKWELLFLLEILILLWPGTCILIHLLHRALLKYSAVVFGILTWGMHQVMRPILTLVEWSRDER